MPLPISVLIAWPLAFFGQARLFTPERVTPPQSEHSTFAQTLRVDSVNIKPAAQGTMVPVEVTVQRLSDKVITAYCLTLYVTYADGATRKSDVMSDLVRSLVPDFAPVAALMHYGDLETGKYFVHKDPSGAAPVSVTAQVKWVLFDDRTVQGNRQAMLLGFALSQREREANYLADLLNQVQIAQTTPAVQRAMASASPTAIGLLRNAISDRAQRAPKLDSTGGPYQNLGRDLDSLGRMLLAGKSVFDSRIAAYERLRAVMLEHSKLKENQ